MGNSWLVLGDFNYVSSNDMMDLGYEGAECTWNHGSSEENRRSARLDRALCDGSWRSLYPTAFVKHLTHSYRPLPTALGVGGGA